MGVLAQLTLLSLFLAGVAAVPLFAYRRANRVLALHRAATGAYLLLAVPAIMPATAVVLWLSGAAFDARLLWLVAVAAELTIDFGPRLAIRLTGGLVKPDPDLRRRSPPWCGLERRG